MPSQWQRKAGEKVNLHGEINEFHKTGRLTLIGKFLQDVTDYKIFPQA